MSKKWLEWAKELQMLSQGALAYCKDPYDRERFERIREISVEIMSEHTDIPIEKMRSLFANETGYQTPKVDIRASIIKNNKILLVKEKLDGRWSMPGGWADIGLSVYDNIIKESIEEAGAVVTPNKVIAILDRNKHVTDDYPFTIYKIFVDCNFIKGEHMDNIETSESGFFSLDNLPDLSVTRNTYEQIKMCFDASNNEYHKVICD